MEPSAPRGAGGRAAEKKRAFVYVQLTEGFADGAENWRADGRQAKGVMERGGVGGGSWED